MGASARQQAIAAEPRQRRHPRLPARRRRLPHDPARRHGVGRAGLQERHVLPQRDASAPVRADGSTVDVDVEAAAQAAQRPRVRDARPGLQGAHRHHRSRDGPLTWASSTHSTSPAARSPPSACAWTSRPRTSPTRSPRARPTARARTAARRSSCRRPAPASARQPSPTPLQRRPRRQGRRHRRGPDARRARVYDPGHPDADAQGYVRDAERQHRDRDDRPDRRLARLRGQRHRDADDQAMFAKTLDLLK